jgi:hypothetical protein
VLHGSQYQPTELQDKRNMKKLIRDMTDANNPSSFSNRMRERRFKRFVDLLGTWESTLRILDIGGTEEFWIQRGWAGRKDVRITAVNLVEKRTAYENIEVVAGDATSLTFGDKSFDVAFSNSVIEHLFTYENQCRMAREIQRVAPAYWVQTPNYWFPMEPHFQIPGWQWFPRKLRVEILRRFRCGRRGPAPVKCDAEKLVDEVRLMTGKELRSAFPGCSIFKEKLFGMTKSLVAYRPLVQKS